MSESGSKVTIIVAIIGLITSVIVAVIGNWDKLFPVSTTRSVMPRSAAANVESAASQSADSKSSSALQPGASTVTRLPDTAESMIPLSGVWHDQDYPRLSNSIEQSGTTFTIYRHGLLSNGVRFESHGMGRLHGSSVGLQYSASYSTGDVSSGQCNGTVGPQGSRMNLNCTDSLLGSFPVKLVR